MIEDQEQELKRYKEIDEKYNKKQDEGEKNEPKENTR